MTSPESAPSRYRPPDIAWVEWNLCGRSFARFLGFWHFKNRETGEVVSYREPGTPCPSSDRCVCRGVGLWPGQSDLVGVLLEYEWVFALKAGKLGFTELECAYDAWALLFRHPNARVHLFSKDDQASRALLRYVRLGLRKLPAAWGIEFMRKVAGGETQKSLIVRSRWMREDDQREIVSYPASGNVAIDQTATHSHVDELSHMPNADALWNSVITTIEPGGSCHIITRGAGDTVYSATLWEAATAAPDHLRGHNQVLYPFFSPFDARPDRDETTREALAESGTYTHLGLSYYLPRTPEEALAGDEESPYIPVEVWDRLEHHLPPIVPGDRTPLVLVLDSAVRSDCFAIVGLTRHPQRPAEPALRLSKVWYPDDFPDGNIDWDVVRNFLMFLWAGGCQNGHARPVPDSAPLSELAKDCPHCLGQRWLQRVNVVDISYDPAQLEHLGLGLKKLGLPMNPFSQGADRLIADAMLFQGAMQGKFSHHGDSIVREHLQNAKAQIPKGEDNKMRIVKKSAKRKIDAIVATSMGYKRVLELPLGPRAPLKEIAGGSPIVRARQF